MYIKQQQKLQALPVCKLAYSQLCQTAGLRLDQQSPQTTGNKAVYFRLFCKTAEIRCLASCLTLPFLILKTI